MMRVTSIALLTTVSLSSVALAQQPVRPSAFEVATIKVNASGPGPSFGLMLLPGGRVFAQNVALRDLIRAAYGLEDSQLEGVPAAMRSTRFDVEARIGGEGTIDTARTMARTLLAERFRLVTHTETRQLPGGFQCPSGLLPGHLSLRGLDMTAFASVLWRRLVQRPVFDRTGLSGHFDIDLTYLPELESINGRPASENPSLPAQILGAPSIFTALQEQLGLKLESSRGPVDVLVVDRAEPLIEN